MFMNKASSIGEPNGAINNAKKNVQIINYLLLLSNATTGGFEFGSNLLACSKMATNNPAALAEISPRSEKTHC